MSRTSQVFIVITVLGALILSGCGGGSTDSSSTTTGSVGETPSNPVKPPTQAPPSGKGQNNGNGQGNQKNPSKGQDGSKGNNKDQTRPPKSSSHNPDLYKNSCAGGICPQVSALAGWQPGPKPQGNPNIVIQLQTFVHKFSPDCEFVFTVSPPSTNPPAPSDLAKTLNPPSSGKKSPPPAQYKKTAKDVYVQPPVINTTLPVMPLSQSGARYIQKQGKSYVVFGTLTLSTPVGATGMCSSSQISSAKQESSKDLTSYLSSISV